MGRNDYNRRIWIEKLCRGEWSQWISSFNVSSIFLTEGCEIPAYFFFRSRRHCEKDECGEQDGSEKKKGGNGLHFRGTEILKRLRGTVGNEITALFELIDRYIYFLIDLSFLILPFVV